MQRMQIITGNWKMYKTIEETLTFVQQLIPMLDACYQEIFLATPFTALSAAAIAANGSPLIIGAQNMHEKEQGAYTGEISPLMLNDAGAKFVLIGHSERRYYFNETDDLINAKLKTALLNGLTPTFCIGESLEDFEAKRTHDILASQLTNGLKNFSKEEIANIILAYEPVWAIGTGKTATADIAQTAHKFCREFVAKNWDQEVADHLTIQYGGSVKPDNIKELLDEDDIDGALIGGASLDIDSFKLIINNLKES